MTGNRVKRSRSPYGERGLKYELCVDVHVGEGSLSLRRAWIEIPASCCRTARAAVALLTESVD